MHSIFHVVDGKIEECYCAEAPQEGNSLYTVAEADPLPRPMSVPEVGDQNCVIE